MSEFIFYFLGFLLVSFGFVVFFGAPYVPTLRRDRQDVFKLYPIKKSDVFVDIGSGDGVLLREAVEQKAQRAIGYEMNPWMYAISRFLSRKHRSVTIHFNNFWLVQLPDDTTVVYTFLNGRYLPRLKKKLEAHVQRTKHPLYFISYGFKIKGRKAIKTEGAMHLYIFEPLQT